MIGFITAFIGYLFLACFLGSLIYVAGTYLLLAYDRRIARGGQVMPPDSPPVEFPRGLRYLFQVALETLAVFLSVILYPLALFFRRPWVFRKIRRRPILLIHGFNHNQSAFIPLRFFLKQAGFGPIYSLTLSHTSRPIETLAQEIDHLANEIEKETNIYNLVLIGHSMGGLIASYYNEEIAPYGKVSHVISLGTPFSGTRLSFWNGGPSAKQMRPSSDLLSDIKKKIYSNSYTRYCQIATQFDNIIFPYQSALLEGKPENQCVLTIPGHLGLLYSPKVAKQITYWLREGLPLFEKKKRRAKKPSRRFAAHS